MTDITIDASVLKERNNTYSSLTDINDANVFTDSYEEKMDQIKGQENELYLKEEESIFIKEINKGQDTYEQEKKEMFHESSTQILREVTTNTTSGVELIIPLIGIAFVVMILLLTKYMKNRKRKWEKNDVDNYTYE